MYAIYNIQARTAHKMMRLELNVCWQPPKTLITEEMGKETSFYKSHRSKQSRRENFLADVANTARDSKGDVLTSVFTENRWRCPL